MTRHSSKPNELRYMNSVRAGRSTTEHIFNLRIICEKHLQHQPKLYHIFVDFKAFEGLTWSLMNNCEEIQRQCQYITRNHWNSVWQCPECSPVQWQYRRLVQDYSWGPTRVSTFTNPRMTMRVVSASEAGLLLASACRWHWCKCWSRKRSLFYW